MSEFDVVTRRAGATDVLVMSQASAADVAGYLRELGCDVSEAEIEAAGAQQLQAGEYDLIVRPSAQRTRRILPPFAGGGSGAGAG